MKKYWTYFSERFPLQTHIPIIGIFTFSAICYSLSAAGATSFIPWQRYLLAFFLTFTLFLLLRISDEFKDHDDDVKYRPYLPVPRGLISLNELKQVGIGVLIAQLLVVLIWPSFRPIYLITMVYLGLMFREFFVESWLRKHQVPYILSHMLIIPLVDLVASSAHWSFAEIAPPRELLWFFLVSFFNGIILEIGRKIKPTDKEEEGVISYTKIWGLKTAPVIWMILMLVTGGLATIAARSINSPFWIHIVLVVCCVSAIALAVPFLLKPTEKRAKQIENISGLWTMAMYLCLGAIPFMVKLYG